jgi:hypothetical protein
MSSISDGSSKTSRNRSSFRPPGSHLARTIVATALPMRLVIARASDMKRSMPTMSAMPTAGMVPKACSPAASVTRPAPVTPAAPFDTSSSSRSRPICWLMDIWVLVAWAMKIAPIVR